MTNSSYNIVIAHYRPDIVSGAEHSIADFADEASDRIRITMLVPGEGRLADFYRKRGFHVWVRRVDGPRRLLPGLHRLQSRSLSRELINRGIDAVLCNTFPAASRVGTASRMAGIPYAIYMRDYIPDQPLHRRMLSQADALLAISRDVIHQHAGMVNQDHFQLAYNYINPRPILERYAAHRTSGIRLLPFAPHHPVVGLVGRLTPYKQPDLFLRAIPHVLKHVPDARFVLVGGAQAREKRYEDSLIKLAAVLGIEQQVKFLGPRSDAVELMSEFSVSCLASDREPLGRVILEAHLLNIPVVVPNTGGPAEIVEDVVTGLHFSSQAVDAPLQLAHHIIRLLEDPALRECLVNKGRERVLNTFANLSHVRIQEEYIAELCASRK